MGINTDENWEPACVHAHTDTPHTSQAALEGMRADGLPLMRRLTEACPSKLMFDKKEIMRDLLYRVCFPQYNYTRNNFYLFIKFGDF